MKKELLAIGLLFLAMNGFAQVCSEFVAGSNNTAHIFSNGHDLVIQTEDTEQGGQTYLFSAPRSSYKSESAVYVIGGQALDDTGLQGAPVMVASGIGANATSEETYGGDGADLVLAAGGGGYCTEGESAGNGARTFIQGGYAGAQNTCKLGGHNGWVQTGSIVSGDPIHDLENPGGLFVTGPVEFKDKIYTGSYEGISTTVNLPHNCHMQFVHGLLVSYYCDGLKPAEISK